MFTTQGASEDEEGKVLSYSPLLEVNKEKQQINIRFEGHRFGISQWNGAKIYITTWDKDEGGFYRDIKDKVSRWHFGTTNSVRQKIADDLLLVLP